MGDSSDLQLLSLVVETYDEEGPVTPAMISPRIEGGLASVRECFERFEDCELVVAVEGGYRPTVTARELLELDIDAGEKLIFDIAPDDLC